MSPRPAFAQEVRLGHEAAVAGALGYLEREACRARRGAGGRVQVPGDGFVAAAFRDRSSRAGDPLLHTHVVVANATRGPDGRWTALDGRELYRHAKTAGYLYQAVLRAELTERLGVEWTEVENGTADLRGVSRG
jgi:conjugative relaxase-like TrwC/TraI family protein